MIAEEDIYESRCMQKGLDEKKLLVHQDFLTALVEVIIKINMIVMMVILIIIRMVKT